MKRFYLSAQRTFETRGCEAIVRSTVNALHRQFGDIHVLVPSDNLARDAEQWPEAPGHGVELVPAYTPAHTRYWVHSQRLQVAVLGCLHSITHRQQIRANLTAHITQPMVLGQLGHLLRRHQFLLSLRRQLQSRFYRHLSSLVRIKYQCMFSANHVFDYLISFLLGVILESVRSFVSGGNKG